jgi:hypothetical protein
MSRRYLLTVLLTCVACSNTAAPDFRSGVLYIAIECPTSAVDPLMCTARASCDLYPCTGLPKDVTALATWTSANPLVATIAAPGVVHAIGIGDTVVSAEWSNSSSPRTISVFPNMKPVATRFIDGSVYRKGMTAATGPIAGAVVEILNTARPSDSSQFVVGRRATTGTTPSPSPPGFFPDIRPERYQLLGIPEGEYTLRVTADGYVTQEPVVGQGSGSDFALEPK